MQNRAVILNVMKDLPFNGSRWILEILRQAQNDEIKGFAKPSFIAISAPFYQPNTLQ
ncbi:hypothetical protein [Fodinibius halophilus]|uniref:hypothetical protein n=1 Tax=Fodinibius halophilus TaxID=1736908 RepID=UPI00197A717D|nr:hypothetical protein [Fodinibius halophilus]